MFRDLRADEIDVRIGQATEKGVSLLLYKDARVDQDILDETVGPMNWQRFHSRENANCTVAIWDNDKQQWVSKEDTGTESNTEKEKGLASDSFKRACVNWGIGRELYTAPFIWVSSPELKTLKQESGRWKCRDTFRVQKINIANKVITGLEIYNEKTRRTCFSLGAVTDPVSPAEPEQQIPVCKCCGRQIMPVRFKSGRVMPIEEIIDSSVRAYGAPMCYECCKVAAVKNDG